MNPTHRLRHCLNDYTLSRADQATVDAALAEIDDAFNEILTICEDANRPWQRLDVAAVARRVFAPTQSYPEPLDGYEAFGPVSP